MAMVARNRGTNGAVNSTPAYAHVVGWGMAVPELVMSNTDISAFVETDDAWIQERTGIKERHIATDRESAATLGLQAARNALDVADILPTDLDLIVVATSTPEHVFPGTASLIQDWLGATRAGAFDLSAACSGFVYALDMAAQSIRSGSIKAALVIGAETMSRVMDWQDRSTCILFGDGAGAVVLRSSPIEGGVLSSVLRSDGAGCDLLAIPTHNVREAGDHKLDRMYMAGSEVFKFATRVVDEGIRQCVEKAGITVEDLTLVVPHQANQRILASVAKKLKMDASKFMSNIERYGNTSAASIPIALCEAIEQKRISQDDYILLIGFGGGLTWAATTIKWGVPQTAQKRLNWQRRRFFYFLARWRRRLTQLQRGVNNLLSFGRSNDQNHG
jgi:3-oxoacyl-[acyl-carrier-protein] synthase III